MKQTTAILRTESFFRSLRRFCMVGVALATGVASGCAPPPVLGPGPLPPPPPAVPQAMRPMHPLLGDQRGFLRLSNIGEGHTPVRIGVLLPFSNGSATTRALAASLMKAAELALFEAGNRDVVLASADEGSGGFSAQAGVRALLAEGAEVIVGPLFAQSALAIAPLTRDRGIPVISFSTDRAVAGDGVYLLSFQPENEVRRIVLYAASRGHTHFAALIPRTVYGVRVERALQESVGAAAGRVVDLERFIPAGGDIAVPAQKIAQSKADAILIPQAGAVLRNIAPALAAEGDGSRQVQYLGTGLWDDPAIAQESALAGGWFAAPDPEAERSFDARYRAAFGSSPQALSSLAYDAISLVALLASGAPYNRFTPQALTDPNGFSGVDGIFRFNLDGTSERGLAVLSIQPGGEFAVVSPAPKTFQGPRS